jgi:hypothetical protein
MTIKRHDSTWDILRSGDHTYIIRNDLIKDESYCLRFQGAAGEIGKPEIFNVCEALEGGDHYLGYHSGDHHYKYVIKGNEYIRAYDIEDGRGLGSVVRLHRDFQGGNFYFQRDGQFYKVNIVYNNDGTAESGYFVKGKRLSERSSKQYEISRDVIALNPICIWGNGDYYYILCEDDVVGLVVKRTTAISTLNKVTFRNFTVPDSVSSFMPGGLVKGKGKPTIIWEEISYTPNLTDIDIHFEKTITTKSGVTKEVVDTVESHWNIHTKTKISIGVLIAKAESTMDTDIGGSQSHKESNIWNLETTVQTTIRCVIAPGMKWGLYRARISLPNLGEVYADEVLVPTDTGKPPSDDVYYH